MIEDFEDGEQVRARIQARDEQMRTYLQENFSGRTWFSPAGVDVLGDDAE